MLFALENQQGFAGPGPNAARKSCKLTKLLPKNRQWQTICHIVAAIIWLASAWFRGWARNLCQVKRISPKLCGDVMKFREHIPIGIQITLLPVLAFIGFVAVLGLQYINLSYRAKINKAEVARISFTDDLRNFQRQMTTVRVSEKNFFVRNSIEDTYVHTHAVESIFKTLKGIETLNNPLVDNAQVQRWTKMLNDYRDIYADATREMEIIGFSENVGLRGAMRNAIHAVENRVKDRNPTLTIALLQMRRYEKDFIIRGDEKYFDMWRTSARLLTTRVAQAPLSTVDRVVVDFSLGLYIDEFRTLAAHKRDLLNDGLKVDAMSRRILKSVGLSLVKASVYARTALDNEMADSRQEFINTAALTVLIALITVLGGRWIGQGLRVSLTLITDAMTQLTRGNLNVRIPATSYSNEIGAMANALRIFRENEKRRLLSDLNLRKAKKQTENIVSSMNEALFEVDPVGVIKTTNPAAEHLLGVPEKDLLGQTLSGFVVGEKEKQRRQGRFNCGAEHEKHGTGETRLLTAGGQIVAVSYSWAASEDDQKQRTGAIITVRDITERKQDERKILQFKRTLDQSTDEVYLFWPDSFRLFYQNRSACKLTGWSVEECVTKTVMDFNPDFDSDWFNRLVQPLLDGEESQIIYERTEFRTGRPVEVAIEYVAPEGDSKPYFVAFVRDITERKAADRAKSEFISTVSHELRTPLTSIKGALGILDATARDELSDKFQKLVTIALTNSNRLARLINDILDFEKIEAGKMKYCMAPMDVSALIREAVEANAGYAETFGVHFTAIGTDHEVRINGDRDRLMQVMSNLMSNAAKFSDKGAAIEISLTRLGDRLRVAVKDSGRGIPEAAQATIFEKFTQADSSDRRRTGGTGLGLNIVKSMVEAHGGQIAFDSKEGVGTTFYFDLSVLGADSDGGAVRDDRPDIAAQ